MTNRGLSAFVVNPIRDHSRRFAVKNPRPISVFSFSVFPIPSRPTFVSFVCFVVNHPPSVPIGGIRGQSAVGSNCRYLADPEIGVHQRSFVVKIRSISFGCGSDAPGSFVVQLSGSGLLENPARAANVAP